MLKLIITVGIKENGDLTLRRDVIGTEPVLQAEVDLVKELIETFDAKTQSLIEQSKHGGVTAKGVNAEKICDNIADQFHRKNKRQ